MLSGNGVTPEGETPEDKETNVFLETHSNDLSESLLRAAEDTIDTPSTLWYSATEAQEEKTEDKSNTNSYSATSLKTFLSGKPAETKLEESPERVHDELTSDLHDLLIMNDKAKARFTTKRLIEANVFFKDYVKKNAKYEVNNPWATWALSFTYVVPTHIKEARSAAEKIENTIGLAEKNQTSTAHYVFACLCYLKSIHDAMIKEKKTGTYYTSTVFAKLKEVLEGYEIPLNNEEFDKRFNSVKLF